MVEDVEFLKKIINTSQDTIAEMVEKLVGLEFILTEIVESPHGAWSNDPVTYRDNVIEWCQERAREGLKLIRDSVTEDISPVENLEEYTPDDEKIICERLEKLSKKGDCIYFDTETYSLGTALICKYYEKLLYDLRDKGCPYRPVYSDDPKEIEKE